MTRKQALVRVCEFFDKMDKTPESIEIVQKIYEIIDDMPFSQWSKETIFDTFDQWIYEHNRIPTTKDISKKGLPPIPVIKNRFGLTGKEFLNLYYPRSQLKCNSLKYCDKTKEEWVNVFKEEFLRIKPFSAVDFNRKRTNTIPTWATFAKIIGVSTWLELLTHCKLTLIKKESKAYSRKVNHFNIKSYIDILLELDKIERENL